MEIIIHLKIFSGASKNLEFNGNGLALAMHINNNNLFKSFFEELTKLDKKFNCKVCIYKNSEIIANLLRIALNKKYVTGDKVLKDGDEVAFIPPVQGG